MKPNFDEMSRSELKAYVLSHRDDDEAIRIFFGRRNPPDSKATWYGPMTTPEGLPIEENIRIAEEAIKQRVEIDREKQQQREKAQEDQLRQTLEREIEAKLRSQIELEVEAKLQENLEKEIEALISAIAEFLASSSGFSSRLAGSIPCGIATLHALLAIRAGIEDFGDFEDLRN
ncbi:MULTISPECIES: hypothetical protein [unclassified Microcoleus]|uniref:DUF6887 family protein n=1 Tax=unclassified Microcoleus TaxID=2642155 RepID=UPI001E1849A2|nr:MULTISPECIES: hypothetical protein [unclassified Microcoleus]MCC3413967.1 hypothetical protein [Microcoleus sp. PH2017_02_FOX_O_A]MCC3588271.1 hypothetical protein [Microcoleus sp. PH2017_30_WIL_O_A]